MSNDVWAEEQETKVIGVSGRSWPWHQWDVMNSRTDRFLPSHVTGTTHIASYTYSFYFLVTIFHMNFPAEPVPGSIYPQLPAGQAVVQAPGPLAPAPASVSTGHGIQYSRCSSISIGICRLAPSREKCLAQSTFLGINSYEYA